MKTTLACLLVATFMVLSFQSNAFAAKKRLIITDEASFYSYTAQLSNNPGSPVGPKPKVKICHKGHTLTVAVSAVPGHLAHGDSIGACPPNNNLSGWPPFSWGNAFQK